MKLEFRKATEADVSLIFDLAHEIWKQHYISIITMEQIDYMLKMMYSEASLKKQMQDGHEFTLLYVDGRPLGYISINKVDEKKYFLNKFYVKMDEQRKGLGTAFLRHLLERIGGAESIELTVNRKNYKAINFYFRNGFVIGDVADFDIGGGFFMNDFIMIRKLK